MSPTPSSVEDRLADYRSVLDVAIAQHSSRVPLTVGTAVEAFDDDLVEIDWLPTEPRRSATGARIVAAAAVVAVLAAIGALLATRSGPDADSPSIPASETSASPGTTAESSNPLVGTAPPGTLAGSGQSAICPGPLSAPAGTLYLGGPPSEQNLAATGFLYSLPAGTSPADVAMKAIAFSVVGVDCGVSGEASADGSSATVTVSPPALPTELRVDVKLATRDGVIGVTNMMSNTKFKIDATNNVVTLQLLDGVPTAATTASVRFKKGDDVWEVPLDPSSHTPLALAVPNGETDRFPDAKVDWALFTLLDADRRVVGVGGGLAV